MIARRGGTSRAASSKQLAIARALAAGPKLVILDEPTGHPAIDHQGHRPRYPHARQGGHEWPAMAIVLVEQYYDFAAELADQYLVMERGEIIQRGRGKDMEAEGEGAGVDLTPGAFHAVPKPGSHGPVRRPRLDAARR